MSARPWENPENDPDHDRDERSEQEWQRRKGERPLNHRAHRGDAEDCLACGKRFLAFRSGQRRCLKCLNALRALRGIPPLTNDRKLCSVCAKPFETYLAHKKRCSECIEAGRLTPAAMVTPCPVCSDRGWLPTGIAHEQWGWLVTPCPMCSPAEGAKGISL